MHTTTATAGRLERLGSASAAEMVVILFEEAIASLENAIDAIARREVERRFHASTRAMEIVACLHDSLDLERGGAVAHSLDRIYRVALARITLVNPLNSATAAREATELLEPLLDAWRRIAADADQLDIMTPAGAALAAAAVDRNAPATRTGL
jgi:flagellar secretion chaperone FliS